MAFARCHTLGHSGFDSFQILLRQLDFGGPEVLLEYLTRLVPRIGTMSRLLGVLLSTRC
jgi:hypothetical protein